QGPAHQIAVKAFSPNAAFAAKKNDKTKNPLLTAQDKIIIFDYSTDRVELLQDIVESLGVQSSIEQRRQLVTVNGNVRFPGVYPFPNKASAKQMIALAGGLTDRAFSLNAELTRYVIDAQQRQTIEHFNIDLSNSHNFTLQEEDSIHIKQLPNWKGTETVVIEGEVMFPGTYTIQR
ncbi:MAG: SLBB domain-containing protein, partial [Sinobacterium sp.]